MKILDILSMSEWLFSILQIFYPKCLLVSKKEKKKKKKSVYNSYWKEEKPVAQRFSPITLSIPSLPAPWRMEGRNHLREQLAPENEQSS